MDRTRRIRSHTLKFSCNLHAREESDSGPSDYFDVLTF